MSVETWKSWAEATEASLTSLAILVGACWAWYRYLRFRESSRCLATSHTADVIRVNGKPRVLRLKVHARNVGKVRLDIKEANFRLYQLEPIASDVLEKRTADGHELKWPLLKKIPLGPGAHFKLEPGETWTVPVDFVLPDGLTKVFCLSFITDERRASLRQRIEALFALLEASHAEAMNDVDPPEVIASKRTRAYALWAALKHVKAVGWQSESIFNLGEATLSSEEETSRSLGGVNGNEEEGGRT